MIKVVANNYLKEECVDEFIRLAKIIVEKTNALDKGCISYQLYRNTENPLQLTMLEEWESMDAINAHMQADHFKEIIPQFDPLCSGEGEIVIFENAW